MIKISQSHGGRFKTAPHSLIGGAYLLSFPLNAGEVMVSDIWGWVTKGNKAIALLTRALVQEPRGFYAVGKCKRPTQIHGRPRECTSTGCRRAAPSPPALAASQMQPPERYPGTMARPCPLGILHQQKLRDITKLSLYLAIQFWVNFPCSNT